MSDTLDGMALADRIKGARLAARLSQKQLEAKSGVSQSVISDLETGKLLSTKFLPELARSLGVELGILDERFERLADERPPPADFLGDRNLPVYAAAEGGIGEMVVSTDPIDLVARPWFLRAVKDGFAVRITGDSMRPAYRPGDLAIINPRLPPERDKDVILAGETHGGDFRATIKHLLTWTPTEWRVEQYNPPDTPPERAKRELLLPKSEWPRALRVVGRYDGS